MTEQEGRLWYKDLINKVTRSKYRKEVRELVMQTSERWALQAAGKLANTPLGSIPAIAHVPVWLEWTVLRE